MYFWGGAPRMQNRPKWRHYLLNFGLIGSGLIENGAFATRGAHFAHVRVTIPLPQCFWDVGSYFTCVGAKVNGDEEPRSYQKLVSDTV